MNVITGYIQNFINGSEQFIALASVIIMWLGLTALGAYASGSKRHEALAPFFGWAIVSFIFTLGGVFTTASFTTIGLITVALAIVSGFLAYRRDGYLLPAGTHKIFILALPLLVLVSGMAGSQWDEFSNWLTTPKLLTEIHEFPTKENAHRGGNLIANPFGWHYINYMASSIGGQFLESAGALTNVMILLTFSIASIRLIRTGMGQEKYNTEPSWKLCAVGVLSTTLLNTTFAQKVVLTSYVDVSTAAITGLSAIIGWQMLGNLRDGRHEEGTQLALQIGLLLALLVNLKQSTLAMAAIVVVALALTGLRDPKIKVYDLFLILPKMVIPAIIIYSTWRYYVSQELAGDEMQILPYSNWVIEYIPQILKMMLIILSKKGAYLLLMLAIVCLGLRGLIHYKTPFDRFAIIAATIFLGHNAFLLFSYVTVFGKIDALRASSYWRYNMQLGLVGVAFSAYGAGFLWQKYKRRLKLPNSLSWLPVALIILAPFIFANKLRFDRFQPVSHYRTVAKDIKDLLAKGSSLSVIDPQGSGEAGVIARYELGGDDIYKGHLSVFHDLKKEAFRATIIDQKYTHLLVHSQRSEWQEVLNVKMDNNHSYLLEAKHNGGWTIIKNWKKP